MHMNYRIGLVSLLFLMLFTACATKRSTPPPPYQEDSLKTDAALAEASYGVSRSLVDLAEMAQANEPAGKQITPPSPKTYGMGALSTIDWSGPVEPLVQQIAKATNYHLRVLGKAPSIPILITIARQETMIGNILRDVGYQCGRRAKIIIFPKTRAIELRYAKN